ncbi:uncharacterized protein LOC143578848 [Bidens hawaiensis]|uniref:uncharacterized protein LOC143578848 n=1 Tax=Bidens hawaiensis TaxID=980011 RepID=UPI00404B5E84
MDSNAFKFLHLTVFAIRLIRISVGGHEFCTTVDTLTQREPQSMVAAMFSGRHMVYKDPETGHVFVDRDGLHFRHILNWLRDGVAPNLSDSEYSELLREAEYYQLLGLVDKINEVLTKKEDEQVDSEFTRGEIIRCVQSSRRNFRGVNLSGLDLSKLDLSNMDLIYACLKNVNFSRAYLYQTAFQDADAEKAIFDNARMCRCNLTGANLRGARMVGANLQLAKLQGKYIVSFNLLSADLQYANLEIADLKNVNLEEANLEGANLKGAKMNNANLKGANLQYATLQNAVSGHEFVTTVDTVTNREPESMLAAMFSGRQTVNKDPEKGCVFVNGLSELERLELLQLLQEAKYYQLLGLVDKITENLSNVGLDYACLKNVNFSSAILGIKFQGSREFIGANLRGAHMSGANLRHAKLQGADLQYAELETVDLKKANLNGANLTNANLKGANLEGANMEGADLMGANFNKANLKGANLRYANLQYTLIGVLKGQ